MITKVKKVVTKTNAGYDLIIQIFPLYYDMKLVTSGINDNSDLIIQFQVFLQPYSQSPLIIYQIEVVSVL